MKQTIKESNGNITILNFPPAKLTNHQIHNYLTIVKSAYGFGVKKQQLIQFSLGLMNTLYPSITKQDSETLFTKVKAIHNDLPKD